MAFSTEYTVMLYGLSCAPSVFQCLINDILRDMLGQFVVPYIDDILLYSPSMEGHTEHIGRVLVQPFQNQLYIK